MSGGITREYTVWCGRCPAWERTAQARNIEDVKRIMGKFGWRFMFNPTTEGRYPYGSIGSKCVCPACAKA